MVKDIIKYNTMRSSQYIVYIIVMLQEHINKHECCKKLVCNKEESVEYVVRIVTKCQCSNTQIFFFYVGINV